MKNRKEKNNKGNETKQKTSSYVCFNPKTRKENSIFQYKTLFQMAQGERKNGKQKTRTQLFRFNNLDRKLQNK